MGTFRIPAGSLAFEGFFEQMPRAVKAFAREGFARLASLSEQQTEALLTYLREGFDPGGEPDRDELAKRLDLPGRDAGALSTVIGFAANIPLTHVE